MKRALKKYADGGDIITWDAPQGGASPPAPTGGGDIKWDTSPGMGEAAVRGALQGSTFGFSDEMAGLRGASGLPESVKAAVPFSGELVGGVRKLIGSEGADQGYNEAVARERAANTAAQGAHPYAYGAGEIAGAVPAMAALPAGELAQGAGLGARMGQGALMGSEYGALSGAGQGTDAESRIVGAGTGAASGAIGGAAAPVAGVALDALGRPIVNALQKFNPIAGLGQTPAAAASQRLGVPISRAAVSESPTVQSAAGALKEVPFVGSPLVKSARQTLQGLDQTAQSTAAGYGSGDTVTAGEAATQGIKDWITGKSRDIADRVYGAVDNLVDPNFQRPLHATSDAVDAINARRANSMIPGQSAAVGEVQDAINAPNGLNYDGVKGLRTYFRDITPQQMVAKGINQQEASQIYNGLTQDLRGTILDGGGPQALTAFDKANNIYSLIAQKRDALTKIIGANADAPPERVVDRLTQLAGSKGNADYNKLVQARQAMGPDAFNEVTSAIVNRMGRTSPDADFSGDRFVTQWNNMSDSGKRLLFNSTNNPQQAQNVEDIMTLSKSFKQLQKMGNPSGTGRVNAIMSALGALGGAVAGTATFGLAAPLSILGTTLGGRGVASALAKPVVANRAAIWSRAYNAAVRNSNPATISMLSAASRNLMDGLKRFSPAQVQGPVPAGAGNEQPQT